MAWKTQNRKDYVSLDAFGMDVNWGHIEEDGYKYVEVDPKTKLSNKLKKLESFVDNLSMKVLKMCSQYDRAVD